MTTNTDKKPKYSIFKKLLEGSNVSRRKFSRDTGIGISTLDDWRVGKSAPKTYKMILIADYFGADIREFFEDE